MVDASDVFSLIVTIAVLGGMWTVVFGGGDSEPDDLEFHDIIYPGEKFGYGIGSIEYLGTEGHLLIFSEETLRASERYIYHRFEYESGMDINIRGHEFFNVTLLEENEGLAYEVQR